jgi:putative tryptophan/tyrosine transport system substrate-binding protein
MASYIRRRKFLATLGGVAAWPIAAWAQQAGKLPTIGYLGEATPAADRQRVGSFVQQLRERGWIEGRTIPLRQRP